MLEEPFATGSTLFHKRDARVKLIGATAISLVLALTSSFQVAGSGCLITSLLLLFSRPDPRLLLKRLISVNIFTLFLWLTLPLTYGGETVLSFASMEISGEGLRLAALISLKTNAILFCFLALLATSTTVSLGHGLEKLGVPPKLTFLLLFSYRQLFVIHQEYQRLQRAAKLRGFCPANTLHTYRTYSYLFAMTLVKSWNRAQRIQQAMILRGFKGRLIPLDQPRPCAQDYLFLIGLLLVSLMLAALSLSPPPFQP